MTARVLHFRAPAAPPSAAGCSVHRYASLDGAVNLVGLDAAGAAVFEFRVAVELVNKTLVGELIQLARGLSAYAQSREL